MLTNHTADFEQHKNDLFVFLWKKRQNLAAIQTTPSNPGFQCFSSPIRQFNDVEIIECIYHLIFVFASHRALNVE